MTLGTTRKYELVTYKSTVGKDLYYLDASSRYKKDGYHIGEQYIHRMKDQDLIAKYQDLIANPPSNKNKYIGGYCIFFDDDFWEIR